MGGIGRGGSFSGSGSGSGTFTAGRSTFGTETWTPPTWGASEGVCTTTSLVVWATAATRCWKVMKGCTDTTAGTTVRSTGASGAGVAGCADRTAPAVAVATMITPALTSCRPARNITI